MNQLQLQTYFRSQLVDVAEPPLWSNDEVALYMDDAQNMFCRLVQGIADATTSAIVNIPVLTNDKFVAIDPRILRVREAQRDYDFLPLQIFNFEDIVNGAYQVAPEQNADYGLTNRFFRLDNTVGVTSAIIEGMGPDLLRLVPLSDRDFTINLIVYRQPINTITAVTIAAAAPLEIDTEHHIALLHWMKYHAYMKQDADTFNKGKAIEAKALFEQYCDQAKHEKDIREAKYRTVKYGGL